MFMLNVDKSAFTLVKLSSLSVNVCSKHLETS